MILLKHPTGLASLACSFIVLTFLLHSPYRIACHGQIAYAITTRASSLISSTARSTTTEADEDEDQLPSSATNTNSLIARIVPPSFTVNTTSMRTDAFCPQQHESDIARLALLHYDPAHAQRMIEEPPNGYKRFVDVELQVIFDAITNVDEVDERVSISATMAMIWNDTRLRWNNTTCGINKIRVDDVTKLWTPRVLVSTYEEAEKSVELDAFIRHDGRVIATRQIRSAKILCPMNSFLFPFDQQKCTFLLYDRTPVRLIPNDVYKKKGISLAKNILQSGIGEWSMVSFEPTANGFVKRMHELTIDDDPVDPYLEKISAVVYVFRINRNSLWHILAWLIPCDISTLVGLLVVFRTARAQGPQMQVAAASMMSLTVFLGNLFHRLPANAESVPLLGIHYIVNFSLLGAVLILNPASSYAQFASTPTVTLCSEQKPNDANTAHTRSCGCLTKRRAFPKSPLNSCNHMMTNNATNYNFLQHHRPHDHEPPQARASSSLAENHDHYRLHENRTSFRSSSQQKQPPPPPSYYYYYANDGNKNHIRISGGSNSNSSSCLQCSALAATEEQKKHGTLCSCFIHNDQYHHHPSTFKPKKQKTSGNGQLLNKPSSTSRAVSDANAEPIQQQQKSTDTIHQNSYEKQHELSFALLPLLQPQQQHDSLTTTAVGENLYANNQDNDLQARKFDSVIRQRANGILHSAHMPCCEFSSTPTSLLPSVRPTRLSLASNYRAVANGDIDQQLSFAYLDGSTHHNHPSDETHQHNGDNSLPANQSFWPTIKRKLNRCWLPLKMRLLLIGLWRWIFPDYMGLWTRVTFAGSLVIYSINILFCVVFWRMGRSD